jgi:hypothetical protein
MNARARALQASDSRTSGNLYEPHPCSDVAGITQWLPREWTKERYPDVVDVSSVELARSTRPQQWPFSKHFEKSTPRIIEATIPPIFP